MKRPHSRKRIPIPADLDPTESAAVSAERYGVSRQTVTKWHRILAARRAYSEQNQFTHL